MSKIKEHTKENDTPLIKEDYQKILLKCLKDIKECNDVLNNTSNNVTDYYKMYWNLQEVQQFLESLLYLNNVDYEFIADELHIKKDDIQCIFSKR